MRKQTNPDLSPDTWTELDRLLDLEPAELPPPELGRRIMAAVRQGSTPAARGWSPDFGKGERLRRLIDVTVSLAATLVLFGGFGRGEAWALRLVEIPSQAAAVYLNLWPVLSLGWAQAEQVVRHLIFR